LLDSRPLSTTRVFCALCRSDTATNIEEVYVGEQDVGLKYLWWFLLYFCIIIVVWCLETCNYF